MSNTMKAIVAAVLLAPALALAEVPGAMSFQGRLLKTDGTPETGSPSIRFTIYDKDGQALWHEDQTVALSNGFYSVKLGASTAFPQNLFDGSARWLGVTVGLGTELAPRQFIATVPYAFKAAQADSATSATTATNAGHATNADSATSASNAAHADAATVADSAKSATNATHATTADSATTASSCSTAVNVQGGSVSASSITLTSGGTANIPGLVSGGFSLASGCGSNGCTSCAGAWGTASCTSGCNATCSCNSGTTQRGSLCIR